MFKKFHNLLRELYVIRTIKHSGFFDNEYYLENNLDVARSCMDPVRHYVRHGWREGRNPNQFFDTKLYLRTYPDVAAAGMNPLYHYCEYGWKEGRNPLGYFLENQYISEQSNIIDSKINCLEYGLKSGQYQHYNAYAWSYRVNEEQLLNKVREYNAQKSKRKAKVVVYTAIIGNYDALILPEYINNDWDYVCFTDHNISGEHIFEIREPDYYNIDPARTARFIKMHPHLYFPEYQYSIWIDANIMIRGPHLENSLRDFIARQILFMCISHPKRNCVYEELKECVALNKDDKSIMKEQIKRYKKEGFPEKNGLLETGILIRKHNSKKIKVFNQTWWDEIENGSFRDQLSITYVLWKQQLPFETLPKIKDVRNHEDGDYTLFLHKGTIHHDIPFYSQPSFMKANTSSKINTKKKFSENHLSSLKDYRIDIIICVHNAFEDVKKCLKSVHDYLLPSHRIILVDDGSDSKTCAFLSTFAQESIKQIRLIRNKKQKGYTKAANIGLKASDAPFVILLNSDTMVPKNWALKLLQVTTIMPDVGIVGPMSNAASWQSVPLIHDNQTGKLAVNLLPNGKSVDDMDKLCENFSDYPLFPRVSLVNGFCYGIKRELMEKIGYLDEIAFPKGYGEEDDYSFRMLDTGFFCAIATHCYVFHAKSKSFNNKKRESLVKSGIKILESRYGDIRIQRASLSMKNNPLIQRVRLGINDACGFNIEDSFENEDSEIIINKHQLKKDINIPIEIYQTVFSDEQVGKVTQPFIEYDIRADNNHSEWHEYWNFLQLYQIQKVKKNRYWGNVSFRFYEKTGLSPRAFYDFIEANLGYDIYFVNPYEYLVYAYYNPWHQGEVWHPGLIEIVQTIMDRLNYNIDIHKLNIPSSLTAYCNFFVGNSFFWNNYISFTKPIFDYIENCPDQRLLGRIKKRAYKTRPCDFRPFIMERMFSTFLAVQGNKIRELKYSYNIGQVLKEACAAYRSLADGYNRLYEELEVYENRHKNDNRNVSKL